MLFQVDANGLLDLDTDTFEQLKPGLSAYPDDPAAAAASLDPLLKTALTVVPEELQARIALIEHLTSTITWD